MSFSLIPNSLFAGQYNGDFFPHGAVTFQTRTVVVIVEQEICVDGQVDRIKILEAVCNVEQLLDAGFVDEIPIEGEVVTMTTADGLVVTIKALDAGISEC